MRRAALASFLIAGLSSFAGIVVQPAVSPMKTGVWYGDFVAATNFAVQADLPLVMICSLDNDSCGYCVTLENALKLDAGRAWVASTRAVFFYTTSDASTDDPAVAYITGIRSFSPWSTEADAVTSTPVIRLDWPGHKYERFSGQTLQNAAKNETRQQFLLPLLADFKNRVMSFLPDETKSWTTFPMGDSPCDRLEALVGVTLSVDVPLVRTNAVELAASNRLVFNFKGNQTEQTVVWSAGEKTKFVRYTMPQNLADKDTVEISLRESGGTVIATRHITALASMENSPKNPYWLGERTTSSLDWGEWSMDIDVVTNKVADYNASHGDKAYAMMFVGGSTWCPDCAMAEENFFSKQAFKDWAIDHKVVFGVLDIPNNPQAAADAAWPSQLRYESSRASDAYVSLRGTAPTNELQRYQSGAGYLSRHSVSYEMATNVAARNAFLMGHDTLNGGWNRPERSNKNRTGVPVLILLRDDGTIAARWNRFSDVGPSAYCDGYLRRFEEIMAQIDDENEEADDDKSTTLREISPSQSIESSVSAVDQADVYVIRDIAENEVMTFDVLGGMAELKMSVLDAEGTELSSASGTAASGFSVTNKFRSAGTYFVKVAPKSIADGEFFGYTNETSTVCDYSLAASGWASCGEFGFAAAVTNVNEDCGEVILSVCRANGSSGEASVRVSLVETLGEDVANRIDWTESVLSWDGNETGVKTIRVGILPDGKRQGDMRLCFRLLDATAGRRLELVQSEQTVNVYDVDYDGRPAYRFVAVSDVRIVSGYQDGDVVEYRLVRGRLPMGIGMYAEGGEIGAMGYATASAGTYTAAYAVTVMRGGATVSSEEMTFKFSVIDYDFAGGIPTLKATQTYGNLPIDDGGVIRGLLTVTVPSDGRLSAKYVTGGAAYAYASDGWASFDRLRGTLTADLTMTTDETRSLRIELNGAVGHVTFDDPETGMMRSVDIALDPWQDDGARLWRGQYTVQMPQTNVVAGANRLGGSAYMALRMNSPEAIAAGTMLYAGLLPNGRAFSGSALLSTNALAQAIVPFCHVSDMSTAPFAFSGSLAIAKDAEQNKDDKNYRWSVTADRTPVWSVPDALGHAGEFNVYGGYYDFDTIAQRFGEDMEGRFDNLAFYADTSEITSGRYGTAGAMDAVAAAMTETNMPQLVEGTPNDRCVSLRFSRKTGVISGNFSVPFSGKSIGVAYRGVVLPGWQGCMGCSLGDESVERPWAEGSCSFTDRRDASCRVRNGCKIALDKFF